MQAMVLSIVPKFKIKLPIRHFSGEVEYTLGCMTQSVMEK